jgi:chaperonin GroES
MALGVKGMKNTGKWLRHDRASFLCRFLFAAAPRRRRSNFGPDMSRVKRVSGRRKYIVLALWAQECQNFFTPLLKPENRFPSSIVPPVREGGRFASYRYAIRRLCMHFRPLHDRVVVRRIEAEEKSSGGIIIPDTAKEKPQEGEVVAVGPGARAEDGTVTALDVKVGDRILFGKWSGTEVRIDGEELLIMKESDILGVIERVESLKKAA